MTSPTEKSNWYRVYNLIEARKRQSPRIPAVHQTRSLAKLDKWYASESNVPRGGILVLPTGAGKTFTAANFLCRCPITRGDKVIWLAHTHHLLEQGFNAFESSVSLISEPRRELSVRVVSGTVGHFKVHSIKSTDDVLICSLPTLSRALENAHPKIIDFLTAANDRLFVVFDEAHHAPAPSYRRLISVLRTHCQQLSLLGLTATPMATDTKKRGCLTKLFPQGIIHQEEPNKLMAAGILSRPVFEQAATQIEPDFDDREYANWVSSFRDLPEDIVENLAINRQRNEIIASHYVTNRDRFGKTIMFADRWFQCDQLREMLLQRGVKADVVYSHIDADPRSSDARNRRAADENATVLAKFKNGELDVLINVRMLTEGTDVPDVQTVFLTRQTTSKILLTQMVGRALRGLKFGGTETAFIVSFIDNWRQHINWASYELYEYDAADNVSAEYGRRAPLQSISIDLVRRLARQMDSGFNVNTAPFTTLLPLGWYRVEFDAQVNATDTDDIESVDRLVMVFDDQKSSFDRFVAGLQEDSDISQLEAISVTSSALSGKAKAWRASYFTDNDTDSCVNDEDIVAIARHMAQNDKAPPRFFLFSERENHDLDALALQFLNVGLTRFDEDKSLTAEYSRPDRLWKSFYYVYDLFKSHYNGCAERLIHAQRHGESVNGHQPTFSMPEAIADREADDETKKEVKVRDGNRCLCCGTTQRLTIDHISPAYFGGNNHFDNLQTLCKRCNRIKAIDSVNFRSHRTMLAFAPESFCSFRDEMPGIASASSRDKWERYLRTCVNFYFRCSAVESIEIGGRGERFRHWRISLFQGNSPAWVQNHLDELAHEIREVRQRARIQPSPISLVAID